MITSDKCYENLGISRGYREDDRLGGEDPYSASKACAEIACSAYYRSFFCYQNKTRLAMVRAGNVIGGGDWAVDRLVPDFVRSILKGKKLIIRNPHAVRPWQHVLEPLYGYLLLAEKLYSHPGKYTGAWNFGPKRSDTRTVEWLAKKLCALWGEAGFSLDKKRQPHETGFLMLDASKAKKHLGWEPKWDLATGLAKIVEWTRAYQVGEKMSEVCWRQIEEYTIG